MTNTAPCTERKSIEHLIRNPLFLHLGEKGAHIKTVVKIAVEVWPNDIAWPIIVAKCY